MAEGVPTGTDEFAGITWQRFLADPDGPRSRSSSGSSHGGVHNTTETLEVDVLVDAGADGVYADEEMQADYLLVKQAAPGGEVCVFDLSAPNPLDDCTASTSPTTRTTTATWSGSWSPRTIGLTTAARTSPTR